MRSSILTVGLALACLVGCTQEPARKAPIVSTASTPANADAAEVTIQPVKLAVLEKAIADRKGQIVVLDLWADFCIPCKKEFPHLLELHQKHGKDGVACLSASVDELDQKAAALKFLQSVNSRIPNYLIDEPFEAWQTKWDVTAVPCVVVYGRDGKLAKRFSLDDPDNQFKYADVEKLVVSMLASK